jgi:DNA-binding SARP family transcriptional activator/Tfp pilus assembly protein PilF
MAHLELRLFGFPEISLGGRPCRPRSAKTLALLAYLALEPGRAHGREQLAALFWGGFPESAGRQSLRQALYSLGSMAGGRLGGWIEAGQESVRLHPHPEVAVDALRFLELSAAADPAGWRAAAALCRAPVLEGVSLRGCEGYEEWRSTTRDRFLALSIQNLDRLVLDAVAREDWPEARLHAESLRALDPAREATSRHLLRILAAGGDAAGIEGEWTRICAVLERDFGAAPSSSTANLYSQLGRGARATVLDASASPVETSPLLRAAREAERVYAFGHAMELYRRALGLLRRERASPAAMCEALLRLDGVLERLGRRSEQLAVIDEALALSTLLGEPGGLAAVLLRKAGVCAYLGESEGARDAAARALDIFRGLDDRAGEAEALRELGFVHWRTEAYAEALECTRAALALHRSLGDVSGEATALHNLAEIHRGLGSPRQALAWYGQALPLHWAASNREGEILTLFGWANALLQTGEAAGARAKYEDALQLSERYGEQTMRSRALHALAMCWRAAGDLDQALHFMRRALEVARGINYAHGLGHDLVDLSEIHWRRGERLEAQAALQEARVWFAFVEDPAALEGASRRLKDLASGRGLDDGAGSGRGWVKSHLSLAEGKVYCEFESPMARAMSRPR